MTEVPADQAFVDAIYPEIMDLDYYRSALTAPDAGGTDVWSAARRALANLSPAEQEAILTFLTWPLVDAVSTVLGTLDGVCYPGTLDRELVVTLGGEVISGDLQDIFLGRAQAEGRI